MLDYTVLLKKIAPQDDGQDVLRLRVGIVAAIASDGTVDVTINEVVVPDVPVLGGTYFPVGSTVQILSYRGSLLVIGPVGAALSSPVALAGNTTTGTTNSTSFVNSLTTTGVHGVAFIAPPSGSVYVIGRATGSVNNAGTTTFLDLDVRTGAVVGSGSAIYTPSLDTASALMSAIANATGPHNVSALVSGLTPGSAYNASLSYAVTNASFIGTYLRRHIAVLPQ